MHVVPLDTLARGESGRISQVCGLGLEVHRLEEMGLRPGADVRMLQPGNPCILALGACQRLSFRGGDETLVLVEVGP